MEEDEKFIIVVPKYLVNEAKKFYGTSVKVVENTLIEIKEAK